MVVVVVRLGGPLHACEMPGLALGMQQLPAGHMLQERKHFA
jgi:hypothetical protein